MRRYRASIEQIETPKNWLDGSGYLLRGIKNKPKNLDRRGIEELSRSLKENFQGEEVVQDECNQDKHQNMQSKRMLSIETHPQLFTDVKHS